MSDSAFAAGSAVAGVPVVVDAERVRNLVDGERVVVHSERSTMEQAVRETVEWDRFESYSGAAWPGCGCAAPCRSCGPLEIVSDGAGRAVLVRGAS